MTSFNQIINSFTNQSAILSLDGFALVLMLYLFLSWLVCVAAAFLKVKDVRYYVGLISMGATLLLALLLGGISKDVFPALAATLTPGGLFLFSALVGVLVCSAPVLQFIWDISYWRGVACILGAIVILAGALIAFHFLANPSEPLQARLSVPLFHKGGASLLR